MERAGSWVKAMHVYRNRGYHHPERADSSAQSFPTVGGVT